MPSVPNPDQVNALIDIGIAAILIVGGFREWYVWGPAHRRQLHEKSEEARFWRDMALGNLRLAERATDAVVSDRDAQ